MDPDPPVKQPVAHVNGEIEENEKDAIDDHHSAQQESVPV
jgi:hypothetical protein